jgi:hypothetical protein
MLGTHTKLQQTMDVRIKIQNAKAQSTARGHHSARQGVLCGRRFHMTKIKCQSKYRSSSWWKDTWLATCEIQRKLQFFVTDACKIL